MATKKTTKVSVPKDEQLENTDFDLFKAIEAIDRKDYGYYARLTQEQQKKFVPYMMLHWISAVKAKTPVAAYYLMSVNQVANRHMFNERVQKHPELQWLMLCASSPGIGKQFHQWIPHLNAKYAELRADATKKDVGDYFAKVYPKMSKDTLADITDGYVSNQRHMRRLAELYPDMKLDDLELLAQLTPTEEIDKYDRDSGKSM